jgi:hypothetical protein
MRRIRLWQLLFLVGVVFGVWVTVAAADSATRTVGVALLLLCILGFFVLVAIVGFHGKPSDTRKRS